MDSRNVIFAIILSSIVLIVWATFFEAPIVDQNIEENQITKNQETDSPSIDEDKKEQISWEKMVNVFETIEIDNVSDGLRIISEKYKLTRQEELSVLAYVKFLEMMVKKVEIAKDILKDKPT